MQLPQCDLAKCREGMSHLAQIVHFSHTAEFDRMFNRGCNTHFNDPFAAQLGVARDCYANKLALLDPMKPAMELIENLNLKKR